MMKSFLRGLKYVSLSLLALLPAFAIWFIFAIRSVTPEVSLPEYNLADYEKMNDSCFRYQDSWLLKNEFGLWEMYISGTPEELGTKNGILAKELIRKQEEAFVSQIRKMIPSDDYLKFLKYVISFMNHRLPDYILPEYKREIFALSKYASQEFNFIGNNYTRQLNYHAAHDIGHAMQNLHLVECTAFGVTLSKSADSSLLLGRNFDFYVGDEFAENKILMFVNPAEGIPFASVTWGGMIGVVSGMNLQGFTVTLNSAKSEIPFFAKTPVSIIAREMLQYASTIHEAYDIACRRPSFVAESFMVSSTETGEMAIIEKTPDTTILYQPGNQSLILTNHFQSAELFNTKMNRENRSENVTAYRYERVREKLDEKPVFDVPDFSEILRDTRGKNNLDIGLGNEGAINQLIAHHSVIFKPTQRLLWISTTPFQLGTYLAFSLDSIFNSNEFTRASRAIDSLNIPADTSFLAGQYLNFLYFKKTISGNGQNPDFSPEAFIASNPNYFYTYEWLGDFYHSKAKYDESIRMYHAALGLFVPNQHEISRIKSKISQIEEVRE